MLGVLYSAHTLTSRPGWIGDHTPDARVLEAPLQRIKITHLFTLESSILESGVRIQTGARYFSARLCDLRAEIWTPPPRRFGAMPIEGDVTCVAYILLQYQAVLPTFWLQYKAMFLLRPCYTGILFYLTTDIALHSDRFADGRQRSARRSAGFSVSRRAVRVSSMYCNNY